MSARRCSDKALYGVLAVAHGSLIARWRPNVGMFDSVYIECPKCGSDVEFQSKAGDCTLASYGMHDVPPEIAGDLHGQSQECRNCGRPMKITTQFMMVAW